MNDQPDQSVRELGSTRLALRGDLIFTPQTAGVQPYYIVEDPLNSRFFRLGHTEYTFVSLLDGRTSILEALSHLSSVLPHHRLTEHDTAGLCRWLVESDLAHTAQSALAVRLACSADRTAQRQALARANPLVFRLPLFGPDRAFATLAPWLSWLYSPWAVTCWLVLLTVGGYNIFADWNRFMVSSRGIFSADNWLWLGACWVMLKVVHETSHGVVCKRYGGTVRETGIMFILFAPLAYVDVTSSWRFRSRRHRINVAAAGMYVELAIAGIAAIVWSNTNSDWLNNLCFNTIVMAGLTTLVFNANPLMKFDGYYILSDALAMPNLYVSGQQYVRYWARRYLLGVPGTLPAWSRGHGAFIRVYGWASLAWRAMICVTMTITAVTLFQGAGVVLACLAAVMWLGLPVWTFAKYFVWGKTGEQPRRLRFLLVNGSLVAICVAVFGFVPWPGAREAPAVVEFSPHTVVRAASAGFVREIRVQSGEEVEKGQLLALLENRELVRDVADLEIQIDQSEIRGRHHEQKGERAAQQAETKNRESLQKQLAERRAQVEKLTVRAPRGGTIVRRNLTLLLGTYLKEGDDMMSLGNQSQKELRLSISQDDLDVFTQRVGQPVRIDIPRQPPWQARLEKVIPRATLEPTYPALTTINGGSLPVKPTGKKPDESTADAFEFLTPRFTAVVALSPSTSCQLHAGQTGSGSYRPCNASIFQHLYSSVSRWIREQLTAG
ncbi:MAG: efflux RND transporter periplasmic adaptor subunit [Pirellulaceae bacterium]|nr:efflux RND transporter periplasmic adaptor subunit [Pirellulaceae bacterium]